MFRRKTIFYFCKASATGKQMSIQKRDCYEIRTDAKGMRGKRKTEYKHSGANIQGCLPQNVGRKM